jgi:hypothetical protein
MGSYQDRASFDDHLPQYENALLAKSSLLRSAATVITMIQDSGQVVDQRQT